MVIGMLIVVSSMKAIFQFGTQYFDIMGLHPREPQSATGLV